MNMILNKFWDTSWKVLVVVFLVVIILFVLIGLIGALVKFIMDKQAKAVDKDMSKLVISRTIDNPKEFKKIANAKSQKRFLKASIAPIIILFITLIIRLIYHLIYGRWDENIFGREDGILSLLYLLDWSSVKYSPPFGFNFSEFVWDPPTPFKDERITNYVIFITLVTGTIYYLVCTQAYASRKIRINKLSKSIYSQDLDKMDLEKFYNSGMKLKKDSSEEEN